MQRSEQINELAAALAKAQGAMAAAKKDAANPFYKSKYADLASVVEAIKAPLSSNGLSYVQLVGSDDVCHYVETWLMHASGQWMSERVRMIIAKPNDPQSFGSAVTYFRRYQLQAIVGVPADDDDANAATGKPGVHRPTDGAEDRLSEPQRRKVQGIVEAMQSHLLKGNATAAVKEYQGKLDADEMVFLWTHFESESGQRAAMKRAEEAMKKAA